MKLTFAFACLAALVAQTCVVQTCAAQALPAPAKPPAGPDFSRWLTPFPSKPADTFLRGGAHAGSVVSRAQCEGAGERGRFVYVEAMGRGVCIRYFVSDEAFAGKAAAVYLPGDKGNFRVSWRGAQYELVPEELLPVDGKPPNPDARPDMARKLGDPERIQSIVKSMARPLGASAIYLARQGTDGSSGWVALRRTRFEVEVTNRALDAIKARHGIDKLHLVGQSGGGHLVGALASLRDDVGCAVAGSAPLSYDPRSPYLSDKIPEPQRFFNPMDYAAAIAKKKSMRLMLVTDGRDARVFVERQAAFVRAMARHGQRPAQFFVSAGDRMSHGVTSYSLLALGHCIAGKSDDEIAVELAKRNAAAMERRLRQQRERAGEKPPVAGEARPPAQSAGEHDESL